MAQKLFIKNFFGERLAAVLHKAPKSKKLVIVCHGMFCNKDIYFYPALAAALAKKGVNAVRFDFAGNGKSEGNLDECTLSKNVEDIQSVADFFKAKGYSISCLIGHSKAGVEALLAQAKYATAEKAVEIACVVDQRSQTIWKYSKKQQEDIGKQGFITANLWGKKYKITKEYFDDRTGYGDIRKFVRKIKVPVLVIHGTADKENDVSNSKLMIKALNKKSRLVLIKGADHFFAKPTHRKQLMDSIIKFLNE
jgi:uncharacterized protein